MDNSCDRELTKPQAGTYRTRLVRDGPVVPVRLDRVASDWQPGIPAAQSVPPPGDPGRLLATVNGEQQTYAYTDEEAEFTLGWELLNGSANVHAFTKAATAWPISEEEYDRLMMLRKTEPPWHPCHFPRQPMKFKEIRKREMQYETTGHCEADHRG